MNKVASRVIALLCGLFLLTFTGSAFAEIKPHALTLTPYISAHIFEGNEGVDNAPEYGLSVAYNFSKHWAAELTGNYMKVDETSPGVQRFRIVSTRLDAIYHIMPEEKIVPYFAFGAGALSIEQDPSSPTHTNEDLSANYGFGVKFFVTDWLAIRTDIRHFFRFDVSEAGSHYNQTYNNLLLSAGLAFQVGGEGDVTEIQVDADEDGIVDSRDRCPDTPPGYDVDRFGCTLDTDGDGVVDTDDMCADTPAGTEVDGNGCPIVVEQPVVQDTDGDGINDFDDKCPNTPAEIPVNAYGCPKDSDGDSIFDVDDDCPNTPAGTSVGPDGCGPDEVNIKLRSEDESARTEAFRSEHPEGASLAALAAMESLDLGIEFAPNMSIIAKKYSADLQQAANFIKAHPGTKIIVEGHTDSTGGREANRKLSQKRADTVRWTLVRDYGVDPKQVVAKGFGESQPIADNNTQEGRAKNRRVVIRAESN